MATSLEYPLQVASLNTIYEKVYDCRVVKPYYETEKWFYNDRFFLDKRFWQKRRHEQDRIYTDNIEMKDTKYYLSHTDTEIYVSADNWTGLVDIAWPFSHTPNNPIKFVKWKGPCWSVLEEFQITWVWEVLTWVIPWLPPWNNLEFYQNTGYIVIPYTGNIASIWDFITFKDWILAWWSNEIEYIDWQYIYIIWTNSRWSLPISWTNVCIFSWDNFWVTLWVWAADWFHVLILDWINPASDIVPYAWNITDAENFNESIFLLSDNKVFYSRDTFDDNTQFYPTDRFRLNGWYKFIQAWKILLWMARKCENLLFSPANTVQNQNNWQNIWYVAYHMNYDWDLYSKYSYVFDDSTLLILQDDKQLMQVDVTTMNNTTFDLRTKNIALSSRWLFEELDWWEVFCNADDRFLHWLWVKDWKTLDTEYDKQYQHWLLHRYKKEIYKIFCWKHLYNWWVSDIETFRDFEEEYEQEINFQVNWEFELMRPDIIRTLFWLHPNVTKAVTDWDDDDRLSLNLNIEIEIWHQLKKYHIPYDNYRFDNHINTSHLQIWHNNIQRYTWNVVSIQNNIHKLWRVHRYMFSWENRFVYWWTYIISDKAKPYINEVLQSN